MSPGTLRPDFQSSLLASRIQGQVVGLAAAGDEIDDQLITSTSLASTTLGIQGKKVDTENLYTLSGRTLTKALATTVFDQWPSIHVSNNNRNALNELYDKATDTFPETKSTTSL